MKTYGRKSRGRQNYDTTLNFDLICRLCLSEDGEMSELFQEDELVSTPIPDKIMASVCIAVYENDGLPTQICQKCFERVDSFHNFKKKCEDSDSQLRKIFNSKKSKESGEVADDEDDDKNIAEGDALTIASASSSKTVKSKEKDVNIVSPTIVVQQKPAQPMEESSTDVEARRGDDAAVFVSSDTGNYVIDVGDLDDKTSDSVETVSFDIDLPSETGRQGAITQSYVGLVDAQPYEIEIDEQEMEEHYLEVEGELEGEVEGQRIVLIRRSMKHEMVEEEEVEDYENGNSCGGQGQQEGEQLLFPFKCEHCAKSFSKRIDLRRHQSVHLERKVHGLMSQGFDCAVCEKWFPNQTTLKRHERSHTGERPFKCTHCDKRFSQAGIMQRHVHTHTGYKPFTCLFCPKGFTQREGLKVHLRSHQPKNPEEILLHECPLCDKSFCHPSGLSRHLLKHTGKTFNCEACPRRFTDPSSLKRHVKIHGSGAATRSRTAQRQDEEAAS